MSQKELVQAIREGNAPLQVAVERLTQAVMAGAIGGAGLEEIDIPLWAPEDEDGECDLTGTPCPESHLVVLKVEGEDYNVHPGVVQFSTTLGRKKLKAETEIPEEYLTVPTTKKLISTASKPMRKKGERPQWSIEDLPSMSRPGLMAAAKDVGLNEKCRELGIDYRRETKEWMAAAISALKLGKKSLPEPEAKKNLEEMRKDGAPAKKKGKKATGKSAKKTKKRSSKSAKKKSKRTSSAKQKSTKKKAKSKARAGGKKKAKRASGKKKAAKGKKKKASGKPKRGAPKKKKRGSAKGSGKKRATGKKKTSKKKTKAKSKRKGRK